MKPCTSAAHAWFVRVLAATGLLTGPHSSHLRVVGQCWSPKLSHRHSHSWIDTLQLLLATTAVACPHVSPISIIHWSIKCFIFRWGLGNQRLLPEEPCWLSHTPHFAVQSWIKFDLISLPSLANIFILALASNSCYSIEQYTDKIKIAMFSSSFNETRNVYQYAWQGHYSNTSRFLVSPSFYHADGYQRCKTPKM